MIKKLIIVLLFIVLWLVGHDLLIQHRFEQNKNYLIGKVEQDIQQHIIKNKDYFERLGKFLHANPDAQINTYGKQTIEQINNNELSGEYLELALAAFDHPQFATSWHNNQLRIHTLHNDSMFYNYRVTLRYTKGLDTKELWPIPTRDKTSTYVQCQVNNPNSFAITYVVDHQQGILLIKRWLLRYL